MSNLTWTWVEDAAGKRWVGSWHGMACYIVEHVDDCAEGTWDIFRLTAWGRREWITWNYSAEQAMRVADLDFEGF